MDEMTKHHTNKLLAKIESISSFSNNYIDNYSIYVFRCSYDDKFSINFVSDGIAKLGYNPSLLISESNFLADFIPEKDFSYFKTVFQSYCDSLEKDFVCEFKFFDSNRNIRNILSHTNIIYDYKSPAYIECFLVDVTEDKQNNSNLKRIINIINNDDMVYVQQKPTSNGNLMVDFASDNFSYYGYSQNDFGCDQQEFFDILYDEDWEILNKQMKMISNNGSTYFANTYRIITPENEIIWAIFENIVHAKNGDITFIETIIHDITEQKEYAIELFESQQILTNNVKHNQLISEILKLLQVTDDYSISLKIIMQKLSSYSNVSTLNIFIPLKDNLNYQLYCYNNKSGELEVKNVALSFYEESYPNILKRLRQYGTAYSDSYGASKECREEFLKNGNYSHLIFNISLGMAKSGYILVIDENVSRTWDNEIITLISDISQIISGLFHRFNIQTELSSAKDTFKTVLDNIDAYVCVTTVDTDEIIFTNKKFNDNFVKNTIGKNCWEVLHIVKKDFVFLETDDSPHDVSSRTHYFEIFCPLTKQWLDITEISVIWNDGNLVKLYTMGDITQKVEYEILIEKQAFNDHLTELPNRRMLERDFPKLLAETIKANGYGYILFLDLDNFKNVNDGLGHQYGDALLHNIASFLKTLKYTGKFSYRFGGDEFIILLSHENCNEIENVIDSLLSRFRKQWKILDTSYFCTMSMGIAKFPYDGTNLFDIMKKVDMAMYSAKNQGKNRVIHYKTKIGFDSIRNIEVERYLRESISNGCSGFMVYYQPVINAITKELEGAEALLRWSCENLGMIPPSEFIPLAENLGLIVELGDFVTKQACIECKRWISMGFENFKMNINLSVGQLIEPNIVQRISNIIIDIGIPFSNIAFEVTESLAINEMEKMKTILNSLSALGIEISLDDFGTGYSSLINIKEMPLNIIKIDKSFIDDFLLNSSTEIFVKTIINLAHALNMRVCAEGVEQENQYNRLVELEADVIQGYYFGRPIPANEFEKQFKMK